MAVPMKQPTAADDVMESVLLKGDIAKLTPNERVSYYREVCRSLGLNPLTKPFEFITLNGRLQLYALRACTDQLRKINDISLEIVSREVSDDIFTVHVRAKTPDGRIDEDYGSVPFPPNLRGEARSNAELKAVTKAKRRATLSICGLGWLDELEVESIPASAKRPAPPAPNVMLPHDASTGELLDDPTSPSAGQHEPAFATVKELASSQSAPQPDGAGSQSWEEYVMRWDTILEDADDARALSVLWNSAVQKKARAAIDWPFESLQSLITRVGNRIAELKGTAA